MLENKKKKADLFLSLLFFCEEEALEKISMDVLLNQYDTLLFDAYGVLVNANEALQGARELIEKLNRINKSYYILSNGSSRSPESTALSYQKKGLQIPSERVINSGSLVPKWINQQKIVSDKVYILGPESCHFMLEGTQCKPCSKGSDDFDLLIIGNQDGYPFVETIDHVISSLFTIFSKKGSIPLLLPNPDLIYPKNQGVGITGGMVAKMIESALQLRFPNESISFFNLGKPYSEIFVEAKRRSGEEASLIMIGDQLYTDVRGANNAGIDSVLIGTGLTKIADLDEYPLQDVPTFTMECL